MKKTFLLLAVLFSFVSVLLVSCNKNSNAIHFSDVYIDAGDLANEIEQLLTKSQTIKINDPYQFNIIAQYYKNNDYKALWISEKNPFSKTDSLFSMIDTCSNQGLQKEWYNHNILKLCKARAALAWYRKKEIDYVQIAKIDILCSVAAAQMGWHTKFGAVNPKIIFKDSFFLPTKKIDSSLTSNILKSGGSTVVLKNITREQNRQYKLLFPHIKKIQQQQWTFIPKIADTVKLHKGDTSWIIPLIAKRLIENGDLDSAYKTPANCFYDTTLFAAMKRYQEKFGLLNDGVIGSGTIKSLQQKPADRATQIAATLERLRWSDSIADKKYIRVNIPEFKLHAHFGADSVWSMKVCVGVKHTRYSKFNYETPSMFSHITKIQLYPTWSVPQNIMSTELYYSFKQNKSFIKNQGYSVYYKGNKVDTDTLNWGKYDPEYIPFRVVQDPGNMNAMGLVYFEFPNDFLLYMHDTPNKYAFSYAFRAVSHGCIRLGQPVKMIEFLIQNHKQWDINDVRVELKSRPEKLKDKEWDEIVDNYNKKLADLEKKGLKNSIFTLYPPEKINLYVDYKTTWIDEKGNLQIREDVYGKDRKILQKFKKIKPWAEINSN